MTNAQFLFGVGVGLGLAGLGAALAAAGIAGGALTGTGLLVLLLNGACWIGARRGRSVAQPATLHRGSAGEAR